MEPLSNIVSPNVTHKGQSDIVSTLQRGADKTSCISNKGERILPDKIRKIQRAATTMALLSFQSPPMFARFLYLPPTVKMKASDPARCLPLGFDRAER